MGIKVNSCNCSNDTAELTDDNRAVQRHSFARSFLQHAETIENSRKVGTEVDSWHKIVSVPLIHHTALELELTSSNLAHLGRRLVNSRGDTLSRESKSSRHAARSSPNDNDAK